MFFRRRTQHTSLDIWPGFVDALATLLIVVIFVLMTFIVSQLSLTDALQGRDQALVSLTQKLNTLADTLGLEKKQHTETLQKNHQLEESLVALQTQISLLKASVGTLETEKTQTQQKNQSLLEELQTLNQSLLDLKKTLNLQTEDADTAKKEFENTLAMKLSELKDLQAQLQTLQLTHQDLTTEHKKNLSLNRLGQYRSEFFAKLQQAIGERSDMLIVGDRFVFQSEVLFEKASAELGVEGKKKLDQLIGALKEIGTKIPGDLRWVLRVDGHTDQLPIKTAQFPSNWELSSARAISVVKYMIEKGIDPHRLVAAGFGEHQPLNQKRQDEKDLARNRRIEFKLDQR
ncbi:peptidoglycan -binding protein [Candidatus Finniella inopinata]|uniref:Peptidoglycan-binding protein n=1 Tax=Candidatus Finniella inopinata TaxID=1696036 RepID=A0A4Q7DI60_9PROT|nr:peptidoglycan -binding protein [Candidatus Finniella inopinata]RZI45859.1 peptidoglycan -binding protein [Candidatus Finniella inopinata]